MALVRVRNNSQQLITLPALGTPDDNVKGPQDSIRLAPGTVTEVEGSRLEMYDSPAFRARFDEKKNGDRADLEILPPQSAPVRTTADLLRQYEEANAGKVVKPAEVVASGNGGRVTASGAPVTSEPGTSGALPEKPIGSALDVVG